MLPSHTRPTSNLRMVALSAVSFFMGLQFKNLVDLFCSTSAGDANGAWLPDNIGDQPTKSKQKRDQDYMDDTMIQTSRQDDSRATRAGQKYTVGGAMATRHSKHVSKRKKERKIEHKKLMMLRSINPIKERR